MVKKTAYIRSLGHYLPPKRMTNDDLEKMLDTTDEWIMTRTGIRERRVLEPGLGNSYMAIRAAQECLEQSGVHAHELDVIIVGTVTPDMLFPSTACLVQRGIGAVHAWGFDLLVGCAGFVFSLATGAQMIESGRYNKVLVIGSDVMSTIVDYEDRSTCVLFGDGAGAALLESCPEFGYGILDFIQHMDGNGGEFLYMKAGGSRCPATLDTVERKEHYTHQEGRQVFKSAVAGMANVSAEILARNRLTCEDLSLFIPHQANLRIIEGCAKRLEIEMDKVFINIDKYANTVGATIPLCLYEALMGKKILKKGDYVLVSAFGAGFAWGSILMRWWNKD